MQSVKLKKLQTLLQSYQNVSNSQRQHYAYIICKSCKRFCKVIKMLAIHNLYPFVNDFLRAANAFAKLSKCQQFTTYIARVFFYISCKRFCKVIKMLAIHNQITSLLCSCLAANAFAKLSKCQQFTTGYVNTKIQITLQTLLQSYQNVSNSQLESSAFVTFSGCKRFCKVIKMLAIHNLLIGNFKIAAAANAFAKLSKCQQFTTRTLTR